MNRPTRRTFAKYVMGGALVAALPQKQCWGKKSKVSQQDMPLVIDLIGPMAFKINQQNVEFWMPMLDQPGKEHEAAIGTSVTSIVLGGGDYGLTGPASFAGDPAIYLTTYQNTPSQIYTDKPKDYDSAKKRFIYLTLPKPKAIVALDPVMCRVYATGYPPPTSYVPCAVGLRFLYDKAGVPTLTPGGVIPFDPSPDEMELNISMGYAPFDYHDPNHAEATYAFNEVSKLFPNLDLQIDFQYPIMTETAADQGNSKIKWIPWGGPLHNCKAAVILLQ